MNDYVLASRNNKEVLELLAEYLVKETTFCSDYGVEVIDLTDEKNAEIKKKHSYASKYAIVTSTRLYSLVPVQVILSNCARDFLAGFDMGMKFSLTVMSKG